MYSKDDLSSRNVATLKDIAKEIGAKIKSSDNKETIIYAILDAQAEQTAQPTKRKRVRISKKEDKVYSVKGKDGENYDVMKNQATGPNLPQETSLFKETPVTDANAPETPQVEEAPATTEESKTSKKKSAASKKKAEEATPAESNSPEPAPVVTKHRGRKSKAELEAIAAAKAAELKRQHEEKLAAQNAAAQEQAALAEAQEPVPADGAAPAANEEANDANAEKEAFIPEAQFQTASEGSSEGNQELIAQLQAKMNAQNSEKPADNHAENAYANPSQNSNVWEGDPGDGTDFIPVIDLPIEDQAAMPTYDIFDRPTSTPASAPRQQVVAQPTAPAEPEYDFSNIITSNGVLEVKIGRAHV